MDNSQVENFASKQTKPLIGIEFIIELITLLSYDWFCILCDVKCDSTTIIPHVASDYHRLKYLEHFFPKFTNTLTKTKKLETNNEYRQKILTVIVGRIEKEIGTRKPTVMTHSDFEHNQEGIRQRIQDSEHFSERDWPESHDILSECLRTALYLDEEMESNTSLLNYSPMENICFETYEEALEKLLLEHQHSYEEHEKNPEQHPLYSDEWKIFWSRRYRELLAEGKDADSHDYKPDWIRYWISRMRELSRLELEKKKELLGKKFNVRSSAAMRIEENISQSTNALAGTAKRLLNERNSLEDELRLPKELKYDTSEPFETPNNDESARKQIAGILSSIILEQGMIDMAEIDLEALLEEILGSPFSETFSTMTESSSDGNKSAENLSDEELKVLLENFARLTTDEQLDLVKQLSVIERTDEKRVDKLRNLI